MFVEGLNLSLVGVVEWRVVEGLVVAVGSGKSFKNGKVVPLDVKAGDKVLFGKYSGTEVKVDGEELVLLREDDVLAVFNK